MADPVARVQHQFHEAVQKQESERERELVLKSDRPKLKKLLKLWEQLSPETQQNFTSAVRSRADVSGAVSECIKLSTGKAGPPMHLGFKAACKEAFSVWLEQGGDSDIGRFSPYDSKHSNLVHFVADLVRDVNPWEPDRLFSHVHCQLRELRLKGKI